MFISMNKQEFQHTIMIYHYYNLVYRKELLEGYHIPIGGGKPKAGRGKKKTEEMWKRVITAWHKIEKDEPVKSIKSQVKGLVEAEDGQLKFYEEDFRKKQQWQIVTKNNTIIEDSKKAKRLKSKEWSWKNEDKLWSHYMNFINNRSLVYWYAQRWSSFRPKARLLGMMFSEIVTNSEMEGGNPLTIKLATEQSFIMDKREWQHWMMFYHLHNLEQKDLLEMRLNEDKEEGQWENEDPSWYAYMDFYEQRGLGNYFGQRWNNYEPKVKTVGFRLVKEIMESQDDELRIRIAV